MSCIYLGRKIKISTAACVVAVLLICTCDKTALLAMMCAVLSHELSHVLAILLYGEKIMSVTLYVSGADIVYTSTRGLIEKTVVSSVGVLANSLLGIILFFNSKNGFLFAVSKYSFAYGAFNALCVRGLDGGNILWNILSFFLDIDLCDKVLNAISVTVLFLIYQLGIYIFFKTGSNFSVLMTCMFLFYDTYCKNAIKRL